MYVFVYVFVFVYVYVYLYLGIYMYICIYARAHMAMARIYESARAGPFLWSSSSSSLPPFPAMYCDCCSANQMRPSLPLHHLRTYLPAWHAQGSTGEPLHAFPPPWPSPSVSARDQQSVPAPLDRSFPVGGHRRPSATLPSRTPRGNLGLEEDEEARPSRGGPSMGTDRCTYGRSGIRGLILPGLAWPRQEAHGDRVT